MEHLDHGCVAKELENGIKLHLAASDWINQNRLAIVGQGHLDQTQARIVGSFAQKLRIDRDIGLLAGLGAVFSKRFGCCYCAHSVAFHIALRWGYARGHMPTAAWALDGFHREKLSRGQTRMGKSYPCGDGLKSTPRQGNATWLEMAASAGCSGQMNRGVITHGKAPEHGRIKLVLKGQDAGGQGVWRILR